jgi:hypothetical protein
MTKPVADEEEFVLHTVAIITARRAAGLERPPQSPEDPWWSEGPHIEKDGRSYYVHAMGCLQSELGRAMHEHPDWYLIAAIVRGGSVSLRGLDDALITLAEVHTSGASLSADERRLALELTPAERPINSAPTRRIVNLVYQRTGTRLHNTSGALESPRGPSWTQAVAATLEQRIQTAVGARRGLLGGRAPRQ